MRPPRVTVELDVPARMRDDTVLRSNIYRPHGTGPWPTLLTRLPYGKDGANAAGKLDAVQAAREGFMVVVQDTRGRFMSDGEWTPLAHEHEDGYDSVEWAARLPGSNGRVGMYGDSYFGHTQWAAAAQAPPSLAAIAPALTWSDPMDGLFARGGALELGIAVAWPLQQGPDYIHRLPISPDEKSRRIDGLIAEYDNLPSQGYWRLPVDEETMLGHHCVPELGAFQARRAPDSVARSRVAGTYERVTVPTLHLAGWHDIFVQGALDNYTAMAALGRDARLIVGPWSHNQWTDPIGGQLFGLRASRFEIPIDEFGDIGGFQLAWFKRHITPDAKVHLPDTPVRIFVMGKNVWRDEVAWPPPVVTEVHYLRSNGSLTLHSPEADEECSEFVYDPRDPAPTVGGNTVMPPAYPAGPQDQRPVEGRADVCVFTSEPVAREVEVTGRVRVILSVETSSPSTDWVARLCDVHPDGRSFDLCDGIVRAAGHPGEPSRQEIDLWSTSNVFLRGHRIRVHVTSSSFPRWDRNLNTGDQRDSRIEIARQRIHHGVDRPSFIELPIRRRTS